MRRICFGDGWALLRWSMCHSRLTAVFGFQLLASVAMSCRSLRSLVLAQCQEISHHGVELVVEVGRVTLSIRVMAVAVGVAAGLWWPPYIGGVGPNFGAAVDCVMLLPPVASAIRDFGSTAASSACCHSQAASRYVCLCCTCTILHSTCACACCGMSVLPCLFLAWPWPLRQSLAISFGISSLAISCGISLWQCPLALVFGNILWH